MVNLHFNLQKYEKMKLTPDDLNDQARYRHLLTLQYGDIVPFVLDYIRRKTTLTIIFWSVCLVFAVQAATIRIEIATWFELKRIFLHTLIGFVVLPVAVIPLHEILHIIPYFFSGARDIRIGMDLKQYMFYVTAHRQVASPNQFRLVAICPFIVISLVIMILVLVSPGLWKWSLSGFLFVHTTMCAGDFALLNFYSVNRGKKIYTWDDADLKEAHFYSEL